jgi:hypothetical protein
MVSVAVRALQAAPAPISPRLGWGPDSLPAKARAGRAQPAPAQPPPAQTLGATLVGGAALGATLIGGAALGATLIGGAARGATLVGGAGAAPVSVLDAGGASPAGGVARVGARCGGMSVADGPFRRAPYAGATVGIAGAVVGAAPGRADRDVAAEPPSAVGVLA